MLTIQFDNEVIVKTGNSESDNPINVIKNPTILFSVEGN